MEILLAAGLFLILLVPLWFISVATRQGITGHRWEDFGIVVRRLEALDGFAEVIGRYMGVDIYRAVTFKGLRYEFDRIAPPSYKSFLKARELYLEPGLVYVCRR